MNRGSHHVGMVGEGHFIAFASGRGWDVFRGLDGHTACDYIVDTHERLIRVEVKRIEAVQKSDKGYYYCTVTKLDTDRFDYLFVSTPQGNYWIPAEKCPKNTLSLKQEGEKYQRNITRPGKYEVYRVSE